MIGSDPYNMSNNITYQKVVMKIENKKFGAVIFLIRADDYMFRV